MPSNSTYDSNIVADSGDETISGFASVGATALTGALTGNVTGDVTSAITQATSHIKIGSGTGCKYLMAGILATQASIVTAAQAIADVTASLQGSMYFSTANPWTFTSSVLATPITVP